MSDDLVKRLRDPAFGADTTERNLMNSAADRIEELEAKLATCEKYRDAYDKMGRIGTEAYRDLEAKLEKVVAALEIIIDVRGYADDPWGVARTTLAELKGRDDA